MVLIHIAINVTNHGAMVQFMHTAHVIIVMELDTMNMSINVTI